MIAQHGVCQGVCPCTRRGLGSFSYRVLSQKGRLLLGCHSVPPQGAPFWWLQSPTHCKRSKYRRYVTVHLTCVLVSALAGANTRRGEGRKMYNTTPQKTPSGASSSTDGGPSRMRSVRFAGAAASSSSPSHRVTEDPLQGASSLAATQNFLIQLGVHPSPQSQPPCEDLSPVKSSSKGGRPSRGDEAEKRGSSHRRRDRSRRGGESGKPAPRLVGLPQGFPSPSHTPAVSSRGSNSPAHSHRDKGESLPPLRRMQTAPRLVEFPQAGDSPSLLSAWDSSDRGSSSSSASSMW